NRLFLPQPHQPLRERRSFHLLSLENCPYRFTVKPLSLVVFRNPRSVISAIRLSSADTRPPSYRMHTSSMFSMKSSCPCSKREISFPIGWCRPPLTEIRRNRTSLSDVQANRIFSLRCGDRARLLRHQNPGRRGIE